MQKEGTQAYLELDGKNVDVLVKNIDFDPLTKKYMALDFQALVGRRNRIRYLFPLSMMNEDKGTGYLRSGIVGSTLQSRPRTSVGSH